MGMAFYVGSKMRKTSISYSILVCLMNVTTSFSAEKLHVLPVPQNYDQALINTFAIMCTLELPNFDHLDARATAMRLQPQKAVPLQLPNGVTLRRKVWGGNLTMGIFTLYVDEISGPTEIITTCANSGNVSDVNSFRAEVMREFRLPTEPKPIFIGGHRAFIFENYAGNGTSLILDDLTPSGLPSIQIKLSSIKKRDNPKYFY